MAGLTGIHGYSTKGTQNLHLQYSQQNASLVFVLTYMGIIITVVLRDSLRITLWYLGVRKVFKLGSLDVSGKLSTYPSPSRHETVHLPLPEAVMKLSTYPYPKPSWNCSPTPPLSRHDTVHLPLPWVVFNTYFSLTAKCWLRGGVGGQFPRNVKWSPKGLLCEAMYSWHTLSS